MSDFDKGCTDKPMPLDHKVQELNERVNKLEDTVALLVRQVVRMNPNAEGEPAS